MTRDLRNTPRPFPDVPVIELTALAEAARWIEPVCWLQRWAHQKLGA